MKRVSLITVFCYASVVLAWEIPKIPAGRRAQYYVIHDDGGYKYGYDTNDGISAQAKADAANEVTGSYTYQGPSGLATLQYTSGIGGFIPVLEGQVAQVKSVAAAAPAAVSALQPSSATGSDEAGTGDASYSFGFDTMDHIRQETSDAAGNVKGSFAFIQDGIPRRLEYEAGANKGFIAQADYLPVPVQDPGFRSSLGGGYSFSYSAGDHARDETRDANGNVVGSYSFTAKDDGISRKVNYEAGANKGFVVTGGNLPSPPALPAVNLPSPPALPAVKAQSQSVSVTAKGSESTGDASYSFSYDAGDHSREEASDATGNVQGSFSFISKDDGLRRKLNYKAGSATGFVAVGDHLPVAPQVGAPTLPASPAVVATKTVISSHNAAVSNDESSGDASYSFAYDAGDHSRQESSDAAGNVQGSYSFVAKNDGIRRKIDYRAGSSTGFVAIGDHLPKAPVLAPAPAVPSVVATKTVISAPNTPAAISQEAPGDASYSFQYDAGDHSRQESSDATGNVQGSYSYVSKDDGLTRKVQYTAGSSSGFLAFGDHLPKAPEAPAALVTKAIISSPAVASISSSEEGTGDASYSFAYDAGDHSRQESSDAAGNVQGSYSYVSKDDGARRKIDYRAGASTGFLAFGDHLPKAPEAPAALVTKAVISSPAVASISTSEEGTGDASYSFAYDAGDHSRQESSDAAGNVQGSYSYVSKDDGARRKIDYRAGASTGFLAFGDHLPKAPEISSMVVLPSAPVAPVVAAKTTPSVVAPVSSEQEGTGDASYSFSYDAGDHSRQESSDAQGNVQGTFSYISKDDGIRRKTTYSAGSSTGFLAFGDHLPKAPELPVVVTKTVQNLPAPITTSGDGAYTFQYDAGHHSRQESGSGGKITGYYSITADGNSRRVDYTADDSGFVARGDGVPPAPAVLTKSGASDGSTGNAAYTYSYKTDSSSKQESSDSAGNVVGSYSYIGGDGVRRKIQYTANDQSGFLAAGDLIPVAPVPVFETKTSSAAVKSSQVVASPLSNFVVKTFLPPNEHRKYGYVFDTKA